MQHAALLRQLKGALADPSAGRALVDVAVHGAIGEPLTLSVTDATFLAAAALVAARRSRHARAAAAAQSAVNFETVSVQSNKVKDVLL